MTRKQRIEELERLAAWRCLKCNTVNGLQSGNLTVRKTCKKCAQPRKNPFTVLQEKFEGQREKFVRDLEKTGITDANEQFDKLKEAKLHERLLP